MKKIILILFMLIVVSSAYSQTARAFKIDTLKVGKTSVSYLIATNHNFNTLTIKGLLTGDSAMVYHVNEAGDTIPVSVRDLNTNTDLNSNLITGLAGVHEFLVLNPNIYRLLIKCTATDIASKDLYIRRRGNNLK